jgi:hypothetical protein
MQCRFFRFLYRAVTWRNHLPDAAWALSMILHTTHIWFLPDNVSLPINKLPLSPLPPPLWCQPLLAWSSTHHIWHLIPPVPQPQNHSAQKTAYVAAYIIIILYHNLINIPSLRIRPGPSSAEQQAVCLVAQPQRYLTLSRIPSGGWPFMWSSSEKMWFARSKLLHNPAPHDMTIFSSLSPLFCICWAFCTGSAYS